MKPLLPRGRDAFGKRGSVGRRRDRMNVMGHEASAVDRQAVEFGLLGKDVQMSKWAR